MGTIGKEYNDTISAFNIGWSRTDGSDITEDDAKQLKEFSTNTIIQGIRDDLREGDMEAYLIIEDTQVCFNGCWNC